MSSYSKPTPPNAGTSANLPADIRDRVHLRSQVIAWTRLDPSSKGELAQYLCCRTFGPFLVLPCFWPHLCIMWPCLLNGKVAMQEEANSQWWILTEQELKILSTDHNASCLPGCCKTGDKVKTIPLENITDCGMDARGTGFMNQCAGDLPTMYVDTASSNNGAGNHEAVGLALEHYEWFSQQIMNQRDIVKGHGGARYHNATTSHAVVAQVVDDRGSGKSVEERIKEIKDLLDKGILTEEEYQKKRQDIISSI